MNQRQRQIRRYENRLRRNALYREFCKASEAYNANPEMCNGTTSAYDQGCRLCRAGIALSRVAGDFSADCTAPGNYIGYTCGRVY